MISLTNSTFGGLVFPHRVTKETVSVPVVMQKLNTKQLKISLVSDIDSYEIESIRKTSSQVEVFNEKKSVGTQLKLPPINSPKRSQKDEKAIQVNFFEKLPRCLDRNFIGSKYFLKSSAGRR